MARKTTKSAKLPASRENCRPAATGKSRSGAAHLPFPVVGVGASAGGLEACTALLEKLPVDAWMAIVVVQHLDPQHRSLLGALLSRVTKMPVAQAEDGTELEPHHVYVIPPNKDVTIRQGALRLCSRQQTGGKYLPIDRFLTSLADDQKSNAIGIILSGTGADGTAGLQAIRAEGGISFAEDPMSAQYPGMPESAIASGCVDFILPPAEIARELLQLRNRNAELGQLADDLNNLLVGVDIPIVILGADRRIRRFTPAAERLLNLIPADIGRPIGDIKPNIDVPELDRLISEVIDTISPAERDLQDRDGRWYSLRMKPWKNAVNKIGGVFMAFLDIDMMRRGLEGVRLSRDEAIAERDFSASLLDLSGALIVMREPDGGTTGFNGASQEASGYSFEEVRNRRLWDFLVAPDEAEQARAVFLALRNGIETVSAHECTWIRRDGSRPVIAWSNLAHRTADGSVSRIISTGIDITSRTLAEDELRQSREQLRRLTANLLKTQEEERKSLARELHDDLNQRMAMLANEVDMLDRNLPAAAGPVHKKLRSVRKRIAQLSDDLRRAAHQLHPSWLEHFGLIAALEAYRPDFSRLHSIRIEFTHRSVPDSIPFEVALCLYRAAQECLGNIVKHAGVKAASIALTGDQGDVVLSVADKGAGFDLDAVESQGGLGLVGLRERVRLVGGTASIRSSPGNGTQIEIRIPLIK